MFTIRPDTKGASIQKYIDRNTDEAKLRTSVERREHLEKIASMNSGKPVYVQISGDMAYADIAQRKDRLGYTDRIIINVPAEVPDQAATNYDQETWDLLFQKAEMYHELGHVLYTDWPSFEKVLFGEGQDYGVDSQLRGVFKNWWNIVEDATIEKLLAQRFNIEDDLRVKNENILTQHNPADSGTMKSIHEAISMALMQYKHPVGWIDVLLDETNDEMQFLTNDDRELFEDEIEPVIDDMIPDIIQESDPSKRNIQMYEFFEILEPHLDIADSPGFGEDMDFGFPDDGDDRGDGGEGLSAAPDTEEDGGIAFDPGERDSFTDFDAQQEYGDDLQEQKKQVKNNQQNSMESLKKWGRIINHDYDLDTDLSIQVPDDPPDYGSYDDATRTEAERMGTKVAKEFRQRLRHQQKAAKQQGKRSGKPDPSAVHKTQQGKTNVFTRQGDPADFDYNCFIVVDRSGSMSDIGYDMMPEVEKAAGALAFGLEEVDIDVGQISMTRGSIQLEKRMDESVEEAKRKMFRGYSGGGTPLSDALLLARERLEERGGHPFVIVLTDGEPDHRERYRDILDGCNFPVVGIYVDEMGDFDEDHLNESAYFHAIEYKHDEEAIDGTRDLAKKVMF